LPKLSPRLSRVKDARAGSPRAKNFRVRVTETLPQLYASFMTCPRALTYSAQA
jgi:hypothetical protein